jgi:hypothetical protein
MKSTLRTALLSACITTAALAGSHDVVTYDEDIRPVMEKNCLMCHGPYSPEMETFESDKEFYEGRLVGPRMDSYERVKIFVDGDDAGALMRRLDDGTHGDRGNMHNYLGRSDAERRENFELFKAWVGHWTLKHDDEMTPADREAIKAPKSH